MVPMFPKFGDDEQQGWNATSVWAYMVILFNNGVSQIEIRDL
jgi:hypothetical protein